MKNQWQIYKKLESIDDAVPPPFISHSPIVNWLGQVRRFRNGQLVERFSYKQQLYHLSRCLNRDCSNPGHTASSRFWRNVWSCLNQPLFQWSFSASFEPEVRRVADQSGRAWWYVYDPRTGQTSYLESEEEVQIWLEERLHY